MRKPSPATVIALVALFVALGGVGIAADGQNLILGKPDNSATHKTGLSTPVNDKALQLTNTNTGTSATALGLTVASGHAPFTVSSQTRVANLNADKLDGIDSGGFLRSKGEIQLWYSPWGYLPLGGGVTVTPETGPSVPVQSTSAGYRTVIMPLDQPRSIFGTTLKLKAVTICFHAGYGAVIVGTGLRSGETGQDSAVYADSYTHSSPEPTCYEVAPNTPTVISGSLYLYIELYFSVGSDYIRLFSVRVTLGT
jgi:hypothetical protein